MTSSVRMWSAIDQPANRRENRSITVANRMGHDSVRAALIYQHKTDEGNRAIANAMDSKIKEAGPDDDDGASGVLARTG
jgi:hypothetical protein